MAHPRSIWNQFPKNMVPSSDIIRRIESLGFCDSSWGNDEYPSFENDETNNKLYIIGNYPENDDDDGERIASSWTITIVRSDDDGHDVFVCSYIVS